MTGRDDSHYGWADGWGPGNIRSGEISAMAILLISILYPAPYSIQYPAVFGILLTLLSHMTIRTSTRTVHY